MPAAHTACPLGLATWDADVFPWQTVQTLWTFFSLTVFHVSLSRSHKETLTMLHLALTPTFSIESGEKAAVTSIFLCSMCLENSITRMISGSGRSLSDSKVPTHYSCSSLWVPDCWKQSDKLQISIALLLFKVVFEVSWSLLLGSNLDFSCQALKAPVLLHLKNSDFLIIVIKLSKIRPSSSPLSRLFWS